MRVLDGVSLNFLSLIRSSIGTLAVRGAATVNGLLTAALGATVTGAGVVVGAPTGGDKGAATINVQTGYYLNGTLLPTTKSFTSADTAISASTNQAFAHGLGVTPVNWKILLVNQTGEFGYSPGDVIENSSSQATAGLGLTVQVDAINITLNQTANPGMGVNKTTHGTVQLTSANWKYRVLAQA